MSTKNLRPMFYALLAVQLGVLILALLGELGDGKSIANELISRAGNWIFIISAAWIALFLISIAAITKNAGLPKSEAVMGLVVLMLVGCAFLYVS